MKKIILFLSFSCAFAYAGEAKNWVHSDSIKGFQHVVNTIAGHKDHAVLFPEFIPAPPKAVTYYVNTDSPFTNRGTINIYIDSTLSCNGASFCNILTFTVRDKHKMQSYKNMQGEIMTNKVTLNNGTDANYTEGFAMGSYWKPNIAWEQDDKLYTLTWQGLPDAAKTRKSLIWMANHLQDFSTSYQAGF